jgi:hypothetical protein
MTCLLRTSLVEWTGDGNANRLPIVPPRDVIRIAERKTASPFLGASFRRHAVGSIIAE